MQGQLIEDALIICLYKWCMRDLINLLNFIPGIRWKRDKKCAYYHRSFIDRRLQTIHQSQNYFIWDSLSTHMSPERHFLLSIDFKYLHFFPFTACVKLQRTTSAYILFSDQTYLLWISDIDRFGELSVCLSGIQLKKKKRKQQKLAENLAARSIKSWPQIVRSTAGVGS